MGVRGSNLLCSAIPARNKYYIGLGRYVLGEAP